MPRNTPARKHEDPTRSHYVKKKKDAEAASNHCHSSVNADWTEVPAQAGSLPHAKEHLPPPLLIPLSPPIVRLRLPPALVQPSSCCSSGRQQATCPIPVT